MFRNLPLLGRMSALALVTMALSDCALVTVSPPPPRAVSVEVEISTLVTLINDHRQRKGCRPLEWQAAVARVAQAHSDDMVERNYFSHVTPEGLDAFQRLGRAGIAFSRAAENIAAGQRTARDVLAAWLASPGHRRNIEDCALRVHGIGLTRGQPSLPYGTVTNAWTHVFVTFP